MIDPALIERIYAAVGDPPAWRVLMQDIADAFGAAGTTTMIGSPESVRWAASPGIEETAQAYFDEGWGARSGRTDVLVATPHPGFLAEVELTPAEVLEAMPVYREFLTPRGLIGGAGTVFQGLRDDAVVFALEGFGSHAASRAAVPRLDLLRPHLGRAFSLSAQVEQQLTQSVVDALGIGGVGAAVIDGHGRLRAANAAFEARFAASLAIGPGGVARFRDAALQAAVGRVRPRDGTHGRSLPIVLDDGGSPAAAHLVPLRGRTRALADSDGVLVMIASAANTALPDADLLRLLFDLTPAEARLARRLVEGDTLGEAAATLTIAKETARKQLAAVFAKTGVARQAELVRVLTRFAPPAETLRAETRRAEPIPRPKITAV